MPGLTSFGLPDDNRMRVYIDVLAAKSAQFAVTAAGEQGSLYDVAQIGRATVYKSPALVRRDIPDDRSIDLFEGLHGAPSIGVGNVSLLVGKVQRCLEDCQNAVGRSLS